MCTRWGICPPELTSLSLAKTPVRPIQALLSRDASIFATATWLKGESWGRLGMSMELCEQASQLHHLSQT